MYHSQSPNIIELPDDIERLESISYVPGESNRVTVTLVLKDSKRFENPTMLYVTNGVEHRILTPEMTLVEDATQQNETREIESHPQDEPKVEVVKKSKKKASGGGDEV